MVIVMWDNVKTTFNKRTSNNLSLVFIMYSSELKIHILIPIFVKTQRISNV